MFKRVALFAAVFALALLPFRANAAYRVLVKNQSNTCAWVTIYVSGGKLDRWVIMRGDFRPKFVKPGETWLVRDLQDWPEVKIRSQFMRHADCTGGEVSNHDIVNKLARLQYEYQLHDAIIEGTWGSYWLRWAGTTNRCIGC